eukprot:TRINITY_DN15963_c0_g1_i3.p1 TRINITY_DN15963_c0_g1~~TRINITY_DN15963_c0_g1_i3.p1  ORF type:complete len:148 (-),score=22.99 TRINITY_DN15963_c0_g1_i3:168-551(-)
MCIRDRITIVYPLLGKMTDDWWNILLKAATRLAVNVTCALVGSYICPFWGTLVGTFVGAMVGRCIDNGVKATRDSICNQVNKINNDIVVPAVQQINSIVSEVRADIAQTSSRGQPILATQSISGGKI